jgi:hypothetical protein
MITNGNLDGHDDVIFSLTIAQFAALGTSQVGTQVYFYPLNLNRKIKSGWGRGPESVN